ncbi:MAG: hypothetical protein H7244_08620 [Herminiimonas sp.]|nr:hypothetical protein [Herminiimonas sp.]
MKHSLLITALLSVLALSACDKKETVVVPPAGSDKAAAPATVVVPTPAPGVVAVPGPAGPSGAPGEPGKTGDAGAPGSSTTVIVPVPAEEKK